MQQDFNNRIMLVVRGDLEPAWQAANTIAHISAYLGNALQAFSTGDNFASHDGVRYPRNTQYPIIIKRAKSSEQLANLLEKVRDADMIHHAFIREMIETTDDKEIEQTLSQKSSSEIELLGVGFFGENEMVNRLAKKYGLWN